MLHVVPISAAGARYNGAVKVYLDGTVLMWLRRIFARSYVHRQDEDQRKWELIDDRIRNDQHGPHIDCKDADVELLIWFVIQLVRRGHGQTYGTSFRRIAKEIETHLGKSIIDQLGDLVREGKPKVVKFGRRSQRDKALDRIRKKHQG
jgi:hypothetical protein